MPTIDPTGVKLITIFAENIDATRQFYVDLLGFSVVDPFTSPDGDFVWLKSGNGGPSIAIQEASKRGTKPVQADVPVASGGLMLGFEVDDAAAAYKLLKDEDGVPFRTELTDMGKGQTFGVKDPEGNYVQIYDVAPQVRDMLQKMGLG